MTEAIRKAAHEEALAQALTTKEAKTPTLVKLFRYRAGYSDSDGAVIGYWANTSLSIAALSSLLLGYWPDPAQNIAFYLVLFAVALWYFLERQKSLLQPALPVPSYSTLAEQTGKK